MSLWIKIEEAERARRERVDVYLECAVHLPIAEDPLPDKH